MNKEIKILVVGQPNGWFLSRAKEEAKKYNMTVDGCKAGAVLSTHDSDGTLITVNGKNIFEYDLIHLFTVQENRLLWYSIAAEARKHGVKIIDQNCVDSLVSEQSLFYKLAKQTELSISFPKTTIVSSIENMITVMKDSNKPIVIKTLDSRKGYGVSLIKNWFDIFCFSLKHRRKQTFAFREFINGIGDYRVTVIGGKACSAIHRIGTKGEWRNNISLGGRGTNIPLHNIPQLVELAQKVSTTFKFDIAGVDIMVSNDGTPYIL